MKNVVHNVKSYCGWTLTEYSTVVYDTLTGVRHLDTISYQQTEKYKLPAARINNQFPSYKHRQVNTEIYCVMSNKFPVFPTILVCVLLFSS